MCRVSMSPRSLLVLLLLTAVAACGGDDGPDMSSATVYEGARLIVGVGTVIENAAFAVEDGRFVWAGATSDAGEMSGATRVDLSGKTVMPTLVNAHFHLSSDRAERTDQLQHMAYYGAGAAISLGLDDGDVGFQMRGETVPNGARSQTAGRRRSMSRC